jgi:ParB/RepB/Spo0J family partition protein
MTKEPTHQFIPVKDIILTPDNPRKVRTDSASFKTLADSVKVNGVRIPIIVRPHPTKKGKFDGLDGARRWAAAKLAKLKVIPALVYENMSDEAAFDWTFLANFARKDLTVLEEAQAVATLLAKNAGDVKAVADKFDKSEKWIRLRANVHGNLSDNWLAVIANIGNFEAERGDRERASDIAHFGIGHYALIARFGKDTQDHILDAAISEEMTVNDLKEECAKLLMDLSMATWDITHTIITEFWEGDLWACNGCTQRTGHQPLLWEDDPKKGEVDRCLDPACWKDHIAAAMAEAIDAAKEKHGDLNLLTTKDGYTENAEIAERFGDLLESRDVETAKKSDKDSFPCFVVRGKQAGKVVWKKKASRGGSRSLSTKPKGPKSMEQKRKELNLKRWCWIFTAMQNEICTLPLAAIQHKDKQLAVMALVAHIGSDQYLDKEGWTEFSNTVKMGVDHAIEQLWSLARVHLTESLTYSGPVTQLGERRIEDAVHIVELLGLDQAKYWTDASGAIPEPKAWANLNENGTPKAKKTNSKQ